MPADQHNASASAVGYLYQVNWCLIELLESASTRPDQAISLETHDDVAWEESGSPVELLQSKHRKHSAHSPVVMDGTVFLLAVTGRMPRLAVARVCRP
jgi:hypothetical protein